MNNIDKAYTDLLQDIIHFGVEKKDRTGTGTISVFGRQIRHRMSEGFPLLTTKKMAFKTMVTELLWFLRGDTSIKYLLENDCNIWTGDAYKNYCKKVIRDKDIVRYLKSYSVDTNGVPTIEPYSKDEFIERIKNDDMFAKKWGSLGRIYGKQWRDWLNLKWEATDKVDPSHPNQPMMKWNIESIDQIANLISELKTNPDSRRLMVNAWNVGELDQMVLPPCHYGFQVYTRELSEKERIKLAGYEDVGGIGQNIIRETVDMDNSIPRRAISLMWNQRSVDTGLGLSFNIASYSLLLMMIAKQVNMVPDEVIGNLGDVHLYLNHIEPIKEQLTREPYELPTVKISDRIVSDISEYTLDDIVLENYKCHPAIKMPLSN